MAKTIISEDFMYVAFLDVEDDGREQVRVYRKCDGGTLAPAGVGRWENGIVLGSGVNCGVLVRLEPSLREQTGTP